MKQENVVLEIEYHVSSLGDDSSRFHAAAVWLVQRFDLRSLDVSISIVDDPTIHRLNREHLDHDWPTDVISFVFEDQDKKIEGEIIASADTAARLSPAAGWTQDDELLLYVIHGLLHLAGMDDINPEDRHQMRLVERECLLALNVPSAEHHLARWENVSY
jgi:rRNA maturation RNase YbeY